MDEEWWTAAWTLNSRRAAENGQGRFAPPGARSGATRTRTRPFCILGQDCTAHIFPHCLPCVEEVTGSERRRMVGVTCRWAEACAVVEPAVDEELKKLPGHLGCSSYNRAVDRVELNYDLPHTLVVCPLHVQMDTAGQFGAACPACAEKLPKSRRAESLWACSACWVKDGYTCCAVDPVTRERCSAEPMDSFKERYYYKAMIDMVCCSRMSACPCALPVVTCVLVVSQMLKRAMAEEPDLTTPAAAIAWLQPRLVEELAYERTPHEAPHHPPGVKMVMGDSLGSAAIAFRWAAEQALSSAYF